MHLSILMSTVALITAQPATQNDIRELVETGGTLIECVVAARAASEDVETEITISADTIIAAYSQGETLFRQVDGVARSPEFEEQIQNNPRDQFLFARSPAFTTGYLLGQAETRALRSLNQDASEQLERDTEGLYDGFLDARVWSGFVTYWDKECEVKFAELPAD